MTSTAGSKLARHGKHVLVAALAAALVVGWAATAARAETITDANVAAAVAAAKTPADHQALATFFTSKAEAAQASVEMHEKMATAFSGKARSVMAAHCMGIAKADKQQVKDYTALAKEQAALAK